VLEYNYYLRFDPALGPFLLRELDDSARAAAEARWAEATAQLTTYLHQQRNSDPHLAAVLTLQELPNLLAALEWRSRGAAAGAIGVETVIDQADSVEYLLQNLGRPRALQRAVAVRERGAAAVKDSGWSHARHLAESNTVERLIDAGRAAEAVPLALRLLAEATAAGEEAYQDAAYDMAICHARLGRALKESGEAPAALGPLDEARARFQLLAEAGDRSAVRMVSTCLAVQADALRALGRLDEAAATYEEAIELAQQRGDPRDVAIGRSQLGTVRLLQRRYGDAFTAYDEARQTFEGLGEPPMVAWAWHHMGVLLRRAEQYDAAETAYLNARRVYVDLGDRPKEAATLSELGNLYGAMGRHEDAVRFYREAATIYADPAVRDALGEGRQHGNAANSLRKLGRLDEARREVERAIACLQPIGHAAEPWKAFGILSEIEQDAGRPEAAFEAWRRVIETYLAYRRDGGENLSGDETVKLCEELLGAVEEGRLAEFGAALDRLDGRSEKPAYLVPVSKALRAILVGNRDPALADDPALDYDDAAEILLLLERLRDLQQVP
ncbi:MAG: tetratricopeptide repeat protein, partial [Isosphaeraceae bacterium]